MTIFKKKFGLNQVAYGLYVVSDSRCPALHECEFDKKGAGQQPRRGQSPVEHMVTFVCPPIQI